MRGGDGNYLAGGAIAGVQEAAEAVVASAVGLAGRSSVRCNAGGALVRVLHHDVGASNMDERALIESVPGLGLGPSLDVVPVCLGGGSITLRSIVLGNNTDKCGSNEEEVLEGNHFDVGEMEILGGVCVHK